MLLQAVFLLSLLAFTIAYTGLVCAFVLLLHYACRDLDPPQRKPELPRARVVPRRSRGAR